MRSLKLLAALAVLTAVVAGPVMAQEAMESATSSDSMATAPASDSVKATSTKTKKHHAAKKHTAAKKHHKKAKTTSSDDSLSVGK